MLRRARDRADRRVERRRKLDAGEAFRAVDGDAHALRIRAKREFLRKRNRGCSPDVRCQGRASHAAQRSQTLDSGQPSARFQLSAAAFAAAAYEKSPNGLESQYESHCRQRTEDATLTRSAGTPGPRSA